MSTTDHRENALQVIPEKLDEQRPDRWTLIRDVAVFQGKLLLDGLRDLLLSPVSIFLAILDLFLGDRGTGRRFYNLLHLGRQTDHWINLFGDANRVPPPEPTPYSDRSVDELLVDLEHRVRRDYEKGGVTASAKDGIDKALDAIQDRLRKTNGRRHHR